MKLMRLGIKFSVVCLIVLVQYSVWSDGGSWQTNQQLFSSIRQNERENAMIEAKTKVLMNKVKTLAENRAVLEGEIRENLGYIQAGEVFYMATQG